MKVLEYDTEQNVKRFSSSKMGYPSSRPNDERTGIDLAIGEQSEMFERQRSGCNPRQMTQNVLKKTGSFQIGMYEPAVKEQ